MTTWVPELDGSAALLDEWHAHLHGDPRYTEPDVPAPCMAERLRANTAVLLCHAGIARGTTAKDPT